MPVYSRKKKLKEKVKTYHFYMFDLNGRTYQGAGKTRQEAAQAEAIARINATRGATPTAQQPTIEHFVSSVYLPYAEAHKKDYEREVNIANHFAVFWRGQKLNQIRAREIREWLDHRARTDTQHKRQRSNGTLNREKSVISSIFSLAVQDDWLEENPCGKVRSRRAAPARLLYWTGQDEQAVLPFLTNERDHLHALVTVALYTGMRREEFLGLRVRQVDFENNLIEVYAPKTNTFRHVGMELPVRAVLLDLCQNRKPDEYVFTNSLTGKRFVDPKKGLKQACALAAVKYIGWHGLRHTRGTRLALRGLNAFQIAAELGHSDIRTSQRYVHLAEAAQRAKVANLAPVVAIPFRTSDQTLCLASAF